jgi:hypothetical protein
LILLYVVRLEPNLLLYEFFIAWAMIPNREFIAPALYATRHIPRGVKEPRSTMSVAPFPESRAERKPSHRRSAIVDEIVATTGATLGFSGERKPSPDRPAIVDTIAAVVIATLALAVFLCLAAISPVVWTFASDTASHLRSELGQCLSVADGGARLACYDEIAHRPPPHPAKGANAPPAAFGQVQPSR